MVSGIYNPADRLYLRRGEYQEGDVQFISLEVGRFSLPTINHSVNTRHRVDPKATRAAYLTAKAAQSRQSAVEQLG